MAPMEKKRKSVPTNDSFVRSKKSAADQDRPSKKQRRDGAGQDGDTRKTPLDSKLTKVQDEEPAFPRGGASLLTPLEHKQIQIQATRDALFEQEAIAGKKSEGKDGNATASKKKQKGKKGKKDVQAQESDASQVKAEGLNYKRIVRGSLILGQISQINEHDVAVALPNNLTGYVPITSISNELTKRVELAAASDELQQDLSGQDEPEMVGIDLKKTFRLGQYVRAYVVSTSSESTAVDTKSKRRIELALNPEQSNNVLSSHALVENVFLMASVVSIEDHGLIMNLGLADTSIRGFMSSKEIGKDRKISDVQEGSVFLCMITGRSSNGKTIKLSADIAKIANHKKLNLLSDSPTVDPFLPGTAVEVLVSEVTRKGIIGKVMGMIDATADLFHSGAGSSLQDIERKYKAGSKIKGRIICTFPASEPPKLGISFLDHIVSLNERQGTKDGEKQDPLQLLKLSTIVDDVKVLEVEPDVGLFVDVGIKGVSGFVHISRVKDGKINTLAEDSGDFKVGSSHRGRLIGYNAMDAVYLLSFEQTILSQPFLRIEDIIPGQIVKGTVEKLIVNDKGFVGVLIQLSNGISGMATELHLADVQLQYPERKFKEGTKITARVLSRDISKRQIRLTLKKSLVNSDAQIFADYADIKVGMQSPGTIIRLLAKGAVVQFYGNVRAFLRVSEMSEAYIEDPKLHFKIGQAVNVHVIEVDAENEKLLVSCKDPGAFGLAQQTAFKELSTGDRVSATVSEINESSISVEIQPANLRALIQSGHLTDGSESKDRAALKKIRVGQTLNDLVIIEKLDKEKLIKLSNKPSILKAAIDGSLIKSFDNVKEGSLAHGFVRDIIDTAVFVDFAGGLVGYLPKNHLTSELLALPGFGLRKHQSIKTYIHSVDHTNQKFVLTMKPTATTIGASKFTNPATPQITMVHPVDEAITSMDDFKVGKLTKARVVSVKETQINVQLAENVQGRIDISEAFESWDQIKDRKHPLRTFSVKQILPVRILGIHDARSHRFLPITHRAGKNLVFELSAKLGEQTEHTTEPFSLKQVAVGSHWIAFVNNVGVDCLWANLSPNVRGRIQAANASDDVSLLNDLETNFPIGSALRVHVTSVDVTNNRLDLSARSSSTSEVLTFGSIAKGMIVPGKITKVTERQIIVQIAPDISAPVHLVDLVDDYTEANPTVHVKNEHIRVCVVDVDKANKKLRLSTRPSRVLNSTAPVKDAELTAITQLTLGKVVRGFVKNISDNGLFVGLGGNLVAYIRVSDLSDSYVKDWKSEYQVDQLVKGRVTRLDASKNQIQMSLKSSVVENSFQPLTRFEDLKVGQVVTGKVRKVEDFGVFIVIDKSANVSGLCHQSEMAEKRIHDVKKLYAEGDAVKAIVLKLDAEKKRISFGLKASYFEDGESVSDESDDNEADGSVDDMKDVHMTDDADSDDESMGGVHVDDAASIASSMSDVSPDTEEVATSLKTGGPALATGRFDWNADILDNASNASEADSEDGNGESKPKKKRRKAEIKIDRTGDLDAHGPQSVSDFERLLLGQPDSSQLWTAYMAFQINLNELERAREIAERAIKAINIREDMEKMNMWIALLNLEMTYGNDESLEEVFKRACQYNDAQEIHERLASSYIHAGKHQVSIMCRNFMHKLTFLRKQMISSRRAPRNSRRPQTSGTTMRTFCTTHAKHRTGLARFFHVLRNVYRRMLTFL